MTTLLIIFASLAFLTLIGAAPLVFAVKNAELGYEDESGFHAGTPPTPAMAVMDVAPAPAREGRVLTFRPAKTPSARVPSSSKLTTV